MAVTKVVLDRQAVGQDFTFGTSSASGEASLVVENGTAADSNLVLDVKGTADVDGDLGVGGDLNLTGDLNVTGNINSQSVTDLDVEDKTITLNSGGTTPADDTSGIVFEGTGASTVAALYYNSSSATNLSVGDGTTQTDLVGDSDTQTLTNKTIDGDNNTVSNLALAAEVTGAITDLSDVAVTAVADNELLAYDNTSGDWINQTKSEAGFGSLATASNISNDDWSGTDLAVGNGGTGSSTASGARTNLGLAIGSDVQAHGDVLDDFNTLGAAASDGQFIVATGAGAFAYESGATVRTSLGLTIGTNVQAHDDILDDLSGLTQATDKVPYFDSATTAATLDFLDEDAMGSNSATAVASQQSIKAYVDSSVAGGGGTTHDEIAVTGTQDGANKTFTLGSSITYGEQIFLNGQLLTEGSTNDYTISSTTLTFSTGFSAPESGDVIRAFGS